MALFSAQDTVQLLRAAHHYARSGDTGKARQLVWQAVSLSPKDEQAWLLLSYVARSTAEKRAALRRALALNPGNTQVRKALHQLIDAAHVRKAAAKGVFISYSRQDEFFAMQIAEDLRAFGINLWLDITDITEAEVWHEAVAGALRRCGLVLMIASPAALRSEDTRLELRRAMDSGKIIVPIQAQSCDPAALSILHPAVDFIEDYQAGLGGLLHLLTSPARTTYDSNARR